MSEAILYKKIIDYLKLKGCFAYRNSCGGKSKYRFGIRGQCDISGILPDGRRLEIEVKTLEGKLSQSQKDFIKIMELNNAIVIVTTDLETVIKRIDKEIKDSKIMSACEVINSLEGIGK